MGTDPNFEIRHVGTCGAKWSLARQAGDVKGRTSNVQHPTSNSHFNVQCLMFDVQCSPSSKSGQALLELVVGLIAILVLTAVIIQLGRLQQAHTQTLLEARAEAGDYAMQDEYTTTLPGPQYIRDWEEGNDQKAYSRDDVPQLGTDGALADDILSMGRPQQLAQYVPDNPITEHSSSGNMEAFALVNGSAQSEDIPLLPIIQRLIYDTDSISMDANVWLTWTEGIQ